MHNQWYVYILQCSDNSLYIGHTENIQNRLNTHNAGLGPAYTAIRRPIQLIYHESHPTKKSTVRREKQIKKWTRAKKQSLIKGDMNRLHQLSKRRHP